MVALFLTQTYETGVERESIPDVIILKMIKTEKRQVETFVNLLK